MGNTGIALRAVLLKLIDLLANNFQNSHRKVLRKKRLMIQREMLKSINSSQVLISAKNKLFKKIWILTSIWTTLQL